MPELNAQQFKGFIRQHFKLSRLPVERCSQILFSQLANMPNYGGLNFPFQFVEGEIRHLEGTGETTTKQVRFSKPLRGFFHKHFYVPGYEHPGVNLSNAWEMNKEASNKFSDMVRPLAEQFAASDQTDEHKRAFAKQVADSIMGGLNKRRSSKKITGDWLVYAKHDGKNYYLCIAKHGEYKSILNRLHLCVQEFPFVKALLAGQ